MAAYRQGKNGKVSPTDEGGRVFKRPPSRWSHFGRETENHLFRKDFGFKKSSASGNSSRVHRMLLFGGISDNVAGGGRTRKTVSVFCTFFCTFAGRLSSETGYSCAPPPPDAARKGAAHLEKCQATGNGIKAILVVAFLAVISAFKKSFCLRVKHGDRPGQLSLGGISVIYRDLTDCARIELKDPDPVPTGDRFYLRDSKRQLQILLNL